MKTFPEEKNTQKHLFCLLIMATTAYKPTQDVHPNTLKAPG